MINNYVKMICGMLDIPMPQVFYNDHAIPPEQHAKLSPDGRQLFLRRQKTATLDQLFAACSELRREWQRRTDSGLYCAGHRTREELPLREFSLQPAEVDCNAFATVMVRAFFGVEPVFDELPGITRSRIEQRAEQIRREEFPELANMKLPH